MACEQRIELEVNGEDLAFNLNLAVYNKFQNASSLVNKVQPATNLLTSTVDDSSKAALMKLLKNPGAALNIVGAVVDEYQPDFEITVKKSKSEQETSDATE